MANSMDAHHCRTHRALGDIAVADLDVAVAVVVVVAGAAVHYH